MKNILQEERDKVSKEIAAAMFLKEKHETEIEQIKAAMEVFSSSNFVDKA